MPPNQEESPFEVTPQDQELTLFPFTDSPIDYASIPATLSDHTIIGIISLALYESLEIPQEPTLKELVQSATGVENVEEVTEVKLRVIARDVSLQHLSFLTPLLRELILDGSVVSSLRDLGCGLKCLKVLRVNRCGLPSLDGTFGLQTLEEIYAGKNRLKDVTPCSHLPNIKVIDVRSNNIQDITALTFLTLCPELEHIVLEDNDKVVKLPQYRKIIKELLPDLKKLDGLEFTEEECTGNLSNYEEDEEDDEEEENEEEGEENLEITSKISPKQSPAKESFLPPIKQPAAASLDTNENTAYTVTFPPKVSPRTSASTSSNSPLDTHKNRSMLPEILRSSASSRLSSAPSSSGSNAPGSRRLSSASSSTANAPGLRRLSSASYSTSNADPRLSSAPSKSFK